MRKIGGFAAAMPSQLDGGAAGFVWISLILSEGASEVGRGRMKMNFTRYFGDGGWRGVRWPCSRRSRCFECEAVGLVDDAGCFTGWPPVSMASGPRK